MIEPPRSVGAAAPARPPSLLIKARNLAPLAEAEAAALAAREEGERIIQEARAEAARIRAQAEVEGRARVSALAAEYAARAAADAAMLGRRLPDLVMAAVRMILQPAPPPEVVARAARRAMEDFDTGAKLTLIAPAGLVEEIRARLERIGGAAHVELKGDPQIPPGSALLQTPWGDVELGLEAQLQALEAGLRMALEGAPPPAAPEGAS